MALRVVTVHVPGALRTETLRAAAKATIAHPELDWRFWEIKEEDELAYGRIITEHWTAGEDFAVVEPDIVIRDDVADGFLSCSEPYCAWPYSWLTDVGPALGCTRFRGEFTRRYPDAMDRAHGVSWRQLDVVLMRHVLVREHSEQPHVHLPPVEHLNEAKRLLPEASREPLMTLPDW